IAILPRTLHPGRPMSVSEATPRTPHRNPSFAPTNWNVVVSAGRSDPGDAAEALSKLCRIYWYPLYAYVRRKGYSVHDAEDLTQGFFEQLLERGSIGQVRGEGKFRSFLLAALEHFISAEWRRAHRQKRGGGSPTIPLELLNLEERYCLEPHDAAA